ncbi:MAG TPA: FAD-dependent oxidoreductase [Pirellulales bacterium]|jgi:hypothetical protein|nr:FAD-dependent oxidoreductase [Pirellulales bacterium]
MNRLNERFPFGLLCFALVLGATSLFAAGEPKGQPHYYYPLPKANPPQTFETDVCVYGATPGGVMAAIQCRRMGKSATLVEFGRHVGGMTASGLSKTDGGKHSAGIATEFYKVVGKADFRPAAAEAQFRRMLAAEGVQLHLEERLAGCTKTGNRITQIEMESGNRFRAKMFVDATYEGDLMAAAKVSYIVGREANATYGETLDGVTSGATRAHNFRFAVDPFVVPGDASSGLLKEISPEPRGAVGQADRRVQAYNFRMFLTRAADRIPFPKPQRYDPTRYTLLARYIAAGAGIGDFMQLHDGDSNNEGGFSTDNIGASDAWPEADYATREKIFQDHVSYQQGLMWFVTHDPQVPAAIRQKISAYGLSPEDFADTGGWPHQLYVREGRRMVSDYVMTEHNCRGATVAEDSVGLAEYNMDSHHCHRFVQIKTDKATGRGRSIVRNEGDVEVAPAGPYPVAYHSIVPKAGECENLLVPVCLSASHIAYGSIRMEPVFMVLGQSAGTAAAMAIDADEPVQKVGYKQLRARLLADHQLLDPPRKKSSTPR